MAFALAQVPLWAIRELCRSAEIGLAFPDMALNAGWIIMAFALAQVPLWATRELCRSAEIGLVQKFKGLFRPNEQWGPKNSRTKLEWIKSVTEREMDEVLSK